MCLAVPGRIVDVAGDDPLSRVGRVDFGGILRQINLAFTPEAEVGDYVLVHVGFAIGIVAMVCWFTRAICWRRLLSVTARVSWPSIRMAPSAGS